jgi:5-methyltetrahydrofolate--homocysteine methyltransferase
MFVEGERAYAPGVFYCKDAFEGLETMDALQESPERRAALTAQLMEDARKDAFLHTNVGKDLKRGSDTGKRSDVSQDHPIPVAPFWGTRALQDIPVGEVLDLLDLDELYRLQWGGRGSGPEFQKMVKEEFEPTLARLRKEAIAEGWLKPRAVYGYFPVQSVNNDLVVYEPEAYTRDGSLVEKSRFHFPRQDGRERLCISDYFRPSSSSDVDVVALQIVTVGDDASQRFAALQAAGEYAEALYSHGIAVEAAEATAEWMHRRVRRELGLPGNRGKRYSWGFGACPDLEDHEQLFKLLPARTELGMDLTSAYQLLPEQSTAAIHVHHPQAKYYAVRTAGEER